MKMAPVVAEMKRMGIRQKLVHTGQHYDQAMAQVFFEELKMPEPDVFLGVGSGSHAEQTARVMVSMEEFCRQHKPAMVVVAGDVNSTVGAAMAASKLGIPVAHVEAGLRSFDRSMPEELNRIVTDHLSDLLFTTEESGNRNLRREGMDESRICFVGNCMIDSLRAHERQAISRRPWAEFGTYARGYALLTLHRPSNVDDDRRLKELTDLASRISERLPVLFPVHPRTREKLTSLKAQFPDSVKLLEPLPYITFLGLTARARVVLTDSGGIQEETTALQTPCLTLRANTERPSTVEVGTNELVGEDLSGVEARVDRVMQGKWKKGAVPQLWDGHAAERIVHAVSKYLRAASPQAVPSAARTRVAGKAA
jgi:UDP-N-acetylglucosamine 2-epimerase (non-hydrolysing)